MGRMRGMGGSGGGVQNKRAGGRFGSSESYILDPLLLPRLEQYSHNNELSNVEATMDYLRTNYLEYRRKQQGPFRKLIVKAVQILKTRLREDGGDSEEDELGGFAAAIARRDGGDEKLQAMEERHLMRSGALRQTDELEAESLDNFSDGVEIEGMSEGSAGARDGRGGQLVESTSRGKRKVHEASVPPAAMADRRRGPGSSRKRFKLRRKDKGTSGSEEELAFDGMDEEKPKLNLLNSSLRTTYSGRPRLVIESCIVADESPRPAFDPGSEKIPASSLDREIVRSNGKMRKTNGGGVNAAENGVAVADRGGSSLSSTPQNVCFKDLGGIEETLEVIREIIEYPLAHPELYDHLGVQPPRGILLHGPPGCGKTMLANAIAVETRVPFLKISAPEVVSGMSGESEAKVRALFAEAVRLAPCIVFIDEIDAITPKRETAQREMERRIVAQLLTCMDDLNQPMGENSVTLPKQRLKHVVVIGATNRPDALDPALRRAGRFDREIALGIPDEKARARILSVLSQNLRLDGSFDFNHIAKRTPGFVGADLSALTTEAAAVAVKRIFLTKHPRLMSSARSDSQRTLPSTMQRADCGKLSDLRKRDDMAAEQCEELSTVRVVKETDSPDSASLSKEIERDEWVEEHWRRPWTRDEMESLSINMQDFEDAVVKVQPSAKREGFATIPDVTWDDVGSLGSVREELEFSISRPIKHPEEYQAMGLEMATGVLLFGPPGCGKTLVAKAIANDAGANFISIKGPELLNKYVGESERAVRQLFTRARASAPCVLFFDEMDAMAPKRGNDGNAAAERVVNQLLTELDGLESRKSVFIIAATNRPDMIDPALLRPGRLDKLLYVPLPDPQGRGSILRTLVRKVPLTGDVNVTVIGESARCDGFSGADLASLIREACIASMRERIAKLSNGEGHRSTEDGRVGVSPNHFNIAFSRVSPSVSTKDRLRYDMLCERIRYARSSIRSSQQETDAAARPVAAAC